MKVTERSYWAVVESWIDITPTVREFTLRFPSDAPAAATHWQPGAHLQVNLTVGAKETQRHYSLLPPKQPGSVRIAVKRVQPGRGGSRAMWSLEAGQALRVSEPLNHFPLDLTAPEYLLVAGGIGITPLLGMAQLLAQRQSKVQMLYCASSEDEFAYADVLQSCLGDRLRIAVGRPEQLGALIAPLAAAAQAYVCGPLGLLQAMQKAWEVSGRAAADLRYETFGAASVEAKPFKVCMPRHQLEFEVDAATSLLDAMEMEGIAAMYGCRKGECGLCVLPVLKLEGEIQHNDVFLSRHEKHSNQQICVCVSRVSGRITLDSAYRAEDERLMVSTLTA